MIIDKIALLLAIVGALNWGGIGLFGFDTVAFFFGGSGIDPAADILITLKDPAHFMHRSAASFKLCSGCLAVIFVPGGRLSVSQTLPPMTELSPMVISPRTEAPE